jgi:epoxyqueuosine reductase
MPMNSPNPHDGKTCLSHDPVRALALEAGFIEAGLIALPHHSESRDADRFTQWLNAGRAGTMRYLERTDDAGKPVRARAGIPFPWARSAIVCMASYNSPQPLSIDPAPPDTAWIARYAQSSRTDPDGQRRPSDYHKILLKRLRELEARMQQEYGAFESRAYVDTGPVVERSLAVAAGLGWQAKNTCLIHPDHGSFTFLAVLLTSLPVQELKAPTAPQVPTAIPDRCGTCRRCIEACPTGALIAPYEMDARLCISYLTIEHRDSIAPELMEQMGRQVFGCDICQDVCPWNLKLSRKGFIATDPGLTPRQELVNPTLDWLASMAEQEFENAFNGSPIRRASFLGLRRNVAIAMGNTRAIGKEARTRFSTLLRGWLQNLDSEPDQAEADLGRNAGLRAAAEWALRKLEGGSPQRQSPDNRSEVRSGEED